MIQDGRFFPFMAPRMVGKMAWLKAEARRMGAVIVTPEGILKWDGKKWKLTPK